MINPFSWIWKAACLGLALALAGTGLALWSTRSTLEKAQEKVALLQSDIRFQNMAVDNMKLQRDAAQEKFQVAMSLAHSNGKKFDSIAQALAEMKKGISCDDAMPAVNMVLKELKR